MSGQLHAIHLHCSSDQWSLLPEEHKFLCELQSGAISFCVTELGDLEKKGLQKNLLP